MKNPKVVRGAIGAADHTSTVQSLLYRTNTLEGTTATASSLATLAARVSALENQIRPNYRVYSMGSVLTKTSTAGNNQYIMSWLYTELTVAITPPIGKTGADLRWYSSTNAGAYVRHYYTPSATSTFPVAFSPGFEIARTVDGPTGTISLLLAFTTPPGFSAFGVAGEANGNDGAVWTGGLSPPAGTPAGYLIYFTYWWA